MISTFLYMLFSRTSELLKFSHLTNSEIILNNLSLSLSCDASSGNSLIFEDGSSTICENIIALAAEYFLLAK